MLFAEFKGYIYTDEEEISKEVDVAKKIDSMEIQHTALQNSDGLVHLGMLKSAMLSMDNAFSEKRMGFSYLTGQKPAP